MDTAGLTFGKDASHSIALNSLCAQLGGIGCAGEHNRQGDRFGKNRLLSAFERSEIEVRSIELYMMLDARSFS